MPQNPTPSSDSTQDQGASLPDVSLEQQLTTEAADSGGQQDAAEETPSVAEPEAGQAGGGETAEEAASRALVEYFDSTYGTQFGQKYRDDSAFLQGAYHAMRRIGERDSDADLGRAIRATGRESELLAYVRGQEAQAQQPQQQSPRSDEPPEFRPEWRYMVEQDPADPNRLRAKAGAPPDVVEKLQRAMAYAEKRWMDLVFRPQEALAPYVEKVKQEVAQSVPQAVGGQIAASQDQAALKTWATENRQWMFVGGDPSLGYTPAGQQLAECFDYQMQLSGGKAPPAHALRAAVLMFQGIAAQQQVQTRAQPAKPGARVKSNVATPQRTQADEEALIANETLEQTLMRHMRAKNAGVTQ